MEDTQLLYGIIRHKIDCCHFISSVDDMAVGSIQEKMELVKINLEIHN